jgi:hypothetical protein
MTFEEDVPLLTVEDFVVAMRFEFLKLGSGEPTPEIYSMMLAVAEIMVPQYVCAWEAVRDAAVRSDYLGAEL